MRGIVAMLTFGLGVNLMAAPFGLSLAEIALFAIGLGLALVGWELFE